MKVQVGTFNQEKALVGDLSVIVKSSRRFVASSSQLCISISRSSRQLNTQMAGLIIRESVTSSSRTVIKNVKPMQLDSIHISTRKEQLYTYFERASGLDCVRLILPLSAI